MKLTPTTFYAAFPDGLLLMSGHEFECAGRMWVVHKKREPYTEDYAVSDKESGMAAGQFEGIRNRAEAVRKTVAKLEMRSSLEVQIAIDKAMKIRATLSEITTGDERKV